MKQATCQRCNKVYELSFLKWWNLECCPDCWNQSPLPVSVNAVPAQVANRSNNLKIENGRSGTGLHLAFQVLGVVEILGGVILCFMFAPGDPGYGNTWKPIAYTMSLTWLAAGVISGLLFFAVAEGLLCLKRIDFELVEARLARNPVKEVAEITGQELTVPQNQ